MRIALFVFGVCLLLASAPPEAPAQAQDDSTYTVEQGDTLYNLARRFGVSVRTLMNWNDLQDTTLQAGQTLWIRPPGNEPAPTEPSDTLTTAPDADPDPEDPPSVRVRAETDTLPPYGHYPVEDGDTFVMLALRLGTTADTLFALNDRTTAPLSVGDTLQLPRRFGPPTHLVEPDETLYSIAGEYGVSVRALQRTNDLDADTVEAGQRLRLPDPLAPSLPPPAEWADPDSTGAVTVYPAPFAGRLTASGVPYDPDDFVVSHPSLPYGSLVLLSTSDPTNHVFARVIDRGPPEERFLLEVSETVAEHLRIDPEAAPTIKLRTVWIADAED